MLSTSRHRHPAARLRPSEHVSDLHADVVIVGGGVTGLTAAYLLAEAGKSVVLLERGRCAMGGTGHTSAHPTMVTDTGLTAMVDAFGPSHAQAVWDAGLAAIARVDDIVRSHQIDADFNWVDGYLHLSQGKEDDKQAEGLMAEASLCGDIVGPTRRSEEPVVGSL